MALSLWACFLSLWVDRKASGNIRNGGCAFTGLSPSRLVRDHLGRCPPCPLASSHHRFSKTSIMCLEAISSRLFFSSLTNNSLLYEFHFGKRQSEKVEWGKRGLVEQLVLWLFSGQNNHNYLMGCKNWKSKVNMAAFDLSISISKSSIWKTGGSLVVFIFWDWILVCSLG